MFENLNLVAVRVGNEGHLLVVGKFLAPVGWPKLNLKVQILELFAVGEPVVICQHRLGTLQMGIAGQNDTSVSLAATYNGLAWLFVTTTLLARY